MNYTFHCYMRRLKWPAAGTSHLIVLLVKLILLVEFEDVEVQLHIGDVVLQVEHDLKLVRILYKVET